MSGIPGGAGRILSPLLATLMLGAWFAFLMPHRGTSRVAAPQMEQSESSVTATVTKPLRHRPAIDSGKIRAARGLIFDQIDSLADLINAL